MTSLQRNVPTLIVKKAPKRLNKVPNRPEDGLKRKRAKNGHKWAFYSHLMEKLALKLSIGVKTNGKLHFKELKLIAVVTGKLLEALKLTAIVTC